VVTVIEGLGMMMDIEMDSDTGLYTDKEIVTEGVTIMVMKLLYAAVVGSESC
jgi:hypothetical protein